jgi:hypothetical protein
MADGWQTYPVEFGGGLITNLSPLQQGVNMPGSARQLRNFEPSIEGGYKRILGYQKFDTSLVPGTGVIRGISYLNGKVVVARNNDDNTKCRLYESGGAGAWTEITTPTVFLDASTSNKIRFCKYNIGAGEKLMVVDGVSYPHIYDGANLTQIPNPPVGLSGSDHVAVYKRLIIIGNGTSLFISAPASDTDFTVASGAVQDLYPANITGLIVFRDTLYVFTEKTISAVNATSFDDVQRQPVSADLGCVEPDTIQEIAGDVIFMGPDGLRLLSGTDKIGDVGLASVTKNIQNEVNSFRKRHNVFTSFLVRGKSQYRLMGFRAGDSTENSQGLLGTQFAQQGGGEIAWAETRGIKAFCSYSEYSGNEEQIFFANNDGYVYQLEQGTTFDGADIDASFYTPYLPIDDPTLRKTIYAVHTYLDPEGSFRSEMRLNYDYNGANTIQPDPVDLTNILGPDGDDTDYDLGTYGTATYATYVDPLNPVEVLTGFVYGDAVRLTLRKQVTGSGFVVSIEYTTTGSTQPFSLDAMALEFATESRR